MFRRLHEVHGPPAHNTAMGNGHQQLQQQHHQQHQQQQYFHQHSPSANSVHALSSLQFYVSHSV